MLQSKSTAKWLTVTLVFSSFVVFAQTSSPVEGVPRFVRFKGQVRDSSSQPLNGQVQIKFAIYNESTGGAAIWEETQIVEFSNGYCSVLLGSGSPGGIPADVFQSGASRWLGVQPLLEGEQEHERIFLTSVPYALKASDADTLGGLPISAFVRNPTHGTEDSTNPGSSETVVANDPPATATERAQANVFSPAVSQSQSAPQTFAQYGTFTNTQMNEFVQSLTNSCSPSEEFIHVQGGLGYATEGLTSCITAPSSSTAHNVNAIAGYARTSAPSSNSGGAVGGYFSSHCSSSNAGCAGANAVVIDDPGLNPATLLTGFEADTQPQNPASNYGEAGTGSIIGIGDYLYAPNSGNYGSAMVIGASEIGQWQTGIYFKTGAIGPGGLDNAIVVSPLGTATSTVNYNSPNILLEDSQWNGTQAEISYWSIGLSTTASGISTFDTLTIANSNSQTSNTNFQLGAALLFPSGLGARPQIVGPTDEPIQITSGNNQNINLAPNGTGAIVISSALEGTTSTATQIGSQNNQNVELSPNGTGQTIVSSLAGKGNGLISVSNTGQLSNAGILISTGRGPGCTTGGSSYATCSSNVTISPAQPNISFIPSCNGSSASGAPAILSVTPASTSSITVTITNGTNNGAEPSTYGTLYCIAIQPSSL